MAHFLGDVSGSRGKASRLGTKKSGMTARLMSWSGCVKVDVWHDEKNNVDRFTVEQTPHHGNGAGIREEIASGIIGERTRHTQPRPGVIGELHTALKAAHDYTDDDESARGREIRKLIENAIQKAEA